MDRRITYVGAIPRSADFLGFQKDALYALGDVIQAMIGSASAVHGLACAPTGPASLTVTVGSGSIFAAETVDGSAYGPIGTDSNTIIKQGLLKSPVSLPVTPPSTSGYSQVYLVEAAYNDIDSGSIILPYFNSTNPQQPLNGPNGDETSQYTIRGGVCAISLKPGAAAPTGTQTAPAVDAGYVPLYLITVTNGQTTITSASIAVHPNSPFIPITLPQVPTAIQQQAGNWAQDTGTANALAISLPPGTTLTAGMPLRIKKGNTANTGAMVASVNNGSPFSIVWSDGSAFAGGDWPANATGEGIYDGSVVRMSSPTGPTIWQRFSNAVSSAITTLQTNLTSLTTVVNNIYKPTTASVARVSLASPQTMPNGATQQITLTGSFPWGSVSGGVLTFSAAGLYAFSANLVSSVVLDSTGGSYGTYCNINQNASQIASDSDNQLQANTTQSATVSANVTVFVTAGDVIQVTGLVGNSANSHLSSIQVLTCVLTIAKISN